MGFIFSFCSNISLDNSISFFFDFDAGFILIQNIIILFFSSTTKPINNKNNNPQLQSINKKKEIKKNEIPKQIINQNENNYVQNLDIKNENHVQTMPLENINNMNYYNKQNIIIPSKPKVEQIDENEGPHFSEGLFLSKLVKSRIYNIDEMSKDQEQFKSDLNYLLEKLNEILTQHGELFKRKRKCFK